MRYPGVDEDGILVALEEDEIKGFAIVSITTVEGSVSQGSVIEFQAETTHVGQTLLQQASDYCNERNLDMLAVAPTFKHADDIFSGWLRAETGVMMARLLSPLPLLKALLDNEDIRNSHAGETIVFRIDDEIIRTQISSESVDVTTLSNYRNSKSAIFVMMSAEVFLEIVMNIRNPYVAYFARKVRIRGLKETVTVLGLLSRMKMNAPLFASLSDRM